MSLLAPSLSIQFLLLSHSSSHAQLSTSPWKYFSGCHASHWTVTSVILKWVANAFSSVLSQDAMLSPSMILNFFMGLFWGEVLNAIRVMSKPCPCLLPSTLFLFPQPYLPIHNWCIMTYCLCVTDCPCHSFYLDLLRWFLLTKIIPTLSSPPPLSFPQWERANSFCKCNGGFSIWLHPSGNLSVFIVSSINWISLMKPHLCWNSCCLARTSWLWRYRTSVVKDILGYL